MPLMKCCNACCACDSNFLCCFSKDGTCCQGTTCLKYRFKFCVCGCFGDQLICDPCALICNEWKGDVHALEAQLRSYHQQQKAIRDTKKKERAANEQAMAANGSPQQEEMGR